MFFFLNTGTDVLVVLRYKMKTYVCTKSHQRLFKAVIISATRTQVATEIHSKAKQLDKGNYN